MKILTELVFVRDRERKTTERERETTDRERERKQQTEKEKQHQNTLGEILIQSRGGEYLYLLLDLLGN